MNATSKNAAADDDVLYSDDFVTVSLSKGVRIKWYYFPFARPKVIKFCDVVDIVEEPEKTLSRLNSKNWGVGVGDVWWACDMRMGRQKYGIVIKKRGSSYRCGFSCRDRAALLKAIRRGLAAAVETE